MIPKPGSYRPLFVRGLVHLLATAELDAEDREACAYYLDLLRDPAFKFGRVEIIPGTSNTDFSRS